MHFDSQLVVSQVNGEFEAKDQRMVSYLKKVGILKHQFKEVEISQISQASNSHANSLATLASSLANPLLRIVSVELFPFSNVSPSDIVLILSIHSSASWIDPLIPYLRSGILPEDKKEAVWIRYRSPMYWVSEEGKLYKRSYSGPYLLCVHLEAVEVLLEDLHQGIYGSHTGGRSLATESLLRSIGGRTCRSKHKNSPKSVINAKGLLLVSISLEVYSTQYPTRGHLPSGGQT